MATEITEVEVNGVKYVRADNKELGKEQRRGDNKYMIISALLIFFGVACLFLFFSSFHYETSQSVYKLNHATNGTISLALASNMTKQNTNILNKEVQNLSYQGNFTISGISPMFPEYFVYEGAVFFVKNQSNLSAGLMDSVYNTAYNKVQLYYPTNLNTNPTPIINDYASVFGSSRTELVYMVCPNSARNYVQDHASIDNLIIPAICSVTDSYYVVGK